MVSVPNVQELARKFMNSNLGQMVARPASAAAYSRRFYGSLGEFFETFKGVIDLSLADIVALPQGEITFGRSSSRRTDDPGCVFSFSRPAARSTTLANC